MIRNMNLASLDDPQNNDSPNQKHSTLGGNKTSRIGEVIHFTHLLQNFHK